MQRVSEENRATRVLLSGILLNFSDAMLLCKKFSPFLSKSIPKEMLHFTLCEMDFFHFKQLRRWAKQHKKIASTCVNVLLK